MLIPVPSFELKDNINYRLEEIDTEIKETIMQIEDRGQINGEDTEGKLHILARIIERIWTKMQIKINRQSRKNQTYDI